jgi:hypothetical protein
MQLSVVVEYKEPVGHGGVIMHISNSSLAVYPDGHIADATTLHLSITLS